jgi:hypothetical protein
MASATYGRIEVNATCVNVQSLQDLIQKNWNMPMSVWRC